MRARELVRWMLAAALATALPSAWAAGQEADASAGSAPVEVDAGQPPLDELLVGAHADYQAGAYDAALEKYRLAASRAGGPHFDYNLGGLLLRSGDLGGAIAAYLRAARELPRDPDVEANLAFARKSVRDSLAPPRASAWARTLFFWHFRLGHAETLRLLLWVNLALWLVLGARLMLPRRVPTGWVAVTLAVVWVALLGSVVWTQLAPRRVAVLLPPVATARAAPEVGGTARFELHAGAEVAVRQERDDWVEVVLPDGQRGWLERSAVERVDL